MAEKEKIKKAKNESKIGPVKFFSWTLRGVSTGACMMVLGYLTLYCTDYLGLNAAVVGLLLVASKAVDAVTDLVAGILVDRTNTKIGRGRPYELAIFGLWICTWLLFSVPASMQTTMKYVWVFVMYVMVNAVFYTLLNANGTAYMVRAFRNHAQYVKLSTMGFVVPMIGVAAFNIALPQLLASMATSHGGWSRLVGMIAILMTAIGILRFIFVPETNEEVVEEEKKEEKVKLSDVVTLFKKDKYIIILFVMTLVMNFSTNLGVGAYYFKYIVGNLGLQSIVSAFQIMSIPLAFVIPALLKRTTCAKVITGGAILYVIGAMIFFFAGANVPRIIAAALLTGIGSVPATMLVGLLLIDLADYHEYIGIPRMEGTLAAVNGFAGKVGAAISTGVSGILLSASGFISTTEGMVEQPDSAIAMIRALASYVPAILWVLVAVSMLGFTIEAKMPQIREELKARRAEMASDTTSAE